MITAGIVVAAFSTGAWFSTVGQGPEMDRYRQARLFERVLDLVRDHYVDSIPESELYREAAYGLVQQLGDPYSVLLTGDDLERADERTSGDYGGIGARIDVRNGWLTVVSTLPDTPAERAGLQTGDRIVRVQDASTKGWTVERAVNTLRGEIGTSVAVAIDRAGRENLFTVSLVRSRVHLRAVARTAMLPGNIGYVAMDAVQSRSASELGTAVGRLYAEGMAGLIIDLRGNPGGIRDEAVRAADLFLDPGAAILETRGRTTADDLRFVDSLPQPWPDLPIVVLVNGGSISAAEIIAGALQDHDRALIVGQTTFGKGLVQTQFQFAPDAALRITTARWFTPSGRSIQRAAVDIEHGQEAVDSASQGPVFLSSAGRSLTGGGGIIPDVMVTPDTLSDRERLLANSLEADLGLYRDALAAIAYESKTNGAITDPFFTVSNDHLEEVASRLALGGLAIPDSIWAGGRSIVANHLTFEIARYVFGTGVELERRLAEDRQVGEAIDLLGRSGSREELFEVAGSPLPVAAPGQG
jgi:carboxyl-terminal processing protease